MPHAGGARRPRARRPRRRDRAGEHPGRRAGQVSRAGRARCVDDVRARSPATTPTTRARARTLRCQATSGSTAADERRRRSRPRTGVQLNTQLHAARRARDRAVPRPARRVAPLLLAGARGAAGKHARLRRRRPHAREPGDRRRATPSRAGGRRCTSAAWGSCSTSCRITWASGRSNPYWEDVLAHGVHSRYARWFDVDWAARPTNKVVLPVLGDELDAVLERGELTLDVKEQDAAALLLRQLVARRSRDAAGGAAARETRPDGGLAIRRCIVRGEEGRRAAARAARRAALPSRLLAARPARDQLPPLLRRQRAGRRSRQEDPEVFDATHALCSHSSARAWSTACASTTSTGCSTR